LLRIDAVFRHNRRSYRHVGAGGAKTVEQRPFLLRAIKQVAQEHIRRLALFGAHPGRELVEEAYILADKGQIIERYLASVDRRKLEQEVAAIDRQMQSTQDPYTRSQLEETRQARMEKIQNVRDLDTYIGRISAQLQNISASLDNVLAETVRLRTADAASADSTTSQVARRLADLKSDMDAFQAVLDTALARSGAM